MTARFTIEPIRLFEGADFVREGVKRRARLLDGRTDDIVCMARLA